MGKVSLFILKRKISSFGFLVNDVMIGEGFAFFYYKVNRTL